jgi:hypothetical protein
MFFARRKAPLVADPGQRVRLLISDDGSRRDGFRAVSGPLTSETGEIVALIVTEEYRDAKRESRRAVGIPWPVEQTEVLLPRRRWRWFDK